MSRHATAARTVLCAAALTIPFATPAQADVAAKPDAVARALRAVERAHDRQVERAERRRARRAAARVATPPHLQAIAACEPGGNPSAIGGGGQFRGKYQFDRGTWASVGGSGDPAAAPEAEQDRRAAMLYARAGASPWPACGS